jgi:hypothetical protein
MWTRRSPVSGDLLLSPAAFSIPARSGVSALSIKGELLSPEARGAELQSRLDSREMPELLHPRMAEVYRAKVASDQTSSQK